MNELGNFARLYWLHALSPLHVGTGRGVGYIDLPIQREKITGWPLVPGTAVKGVLADRNKAWTQDDREKNPWLKRAFGMAGDENANAGSLVFSDARPVCLPVRSLYGTFAWCTSPLVLKRLARDLKTAGLNKDFQEVAIQEGTVWVPKLSESKLSEGSKVYFEDLDFEARENAQVARLSSLLAGWIFPGEASDWRQEFKQRFVVVSDTVFDFLSEYATEVSARIRIDSETGTVSSGGLWSEESLPAETILAGLVWCDRIYGPKKPEPGLRQKLLDKFCGKEILLQIGGKATVGRGQVRCLFTRAEGGPKKSQLSPPVTNHPTKDTAKGGAHA